ncbi:hypothetical protein, partial [Enterobacter hormaechei]|uniref:hypothetical protein n=1 Tax=Enterobacter hormaechei TaxID=158836 RepID=UPI001952B01C
MKRKRATLPGSAVDGPLTIRAEKVKKSAGLLTGIGIPECKFPGAHAPRGASIAAGSRLHGERGDGHFL